MRRIMSYVFILILCILFMFSGCGNLESRTGQGSPDFYQDVRQQAGGDAAADSLPKAEELLKEDQLLELGDHMAACHVPREEVEKGYGFRVREAFQGTYYIAIRDLDSDSVWYLPDVYGRIIEMAEAPAGVCLRYIPDGSEEIREERIPLYSPGRDEGKGIDIYSLCPREKVIIGAWQGLEAGTEALPRKVWEESFRMEEEIYTVLFERVSPVYDPGYETGEIDADYRLTVRDGKENVLSRQTIFHYPVAFEEVYWLMDFSGDGFSDIAFCTDIYRGSGGAWSVLDILIWNAEAGCYEEKSIDGAGSLHLWNPDISSLVVCADENDNIYWAKEMYAWVDEGWQRTGRLERVYSETEFYEMPGRGMFPYPDGYRELVYSGGELAEEKRLEKDFYEEDAFWSDTECIWSERYKSSVLLYPVWPEWEEVTTVIGKTSIEKYIRVVSKP